MSVEAIARLKYVSVPPRKMRLVADMVRGMPVEKALNLLNFTPRIAAHHIAKTLKSAAANALSQEGTAHLKPENLCVKKIVVDAAPTAKRIRFQSMGRVFRIRKRYCHLTIVLEEKIDSKAARATGPEKGKREIKETAVKGVKSTTGKKQTVRKTTAKKKTTKKTIARKTTEGKESAKPKKRAKSAG